jgi:histidine phosphotransfer protein HptB
MNNQLHVDMATLDVLQEVLEDSFAGLLATYMEDSQARIESLKVGLLEADVDLVRRSAHSLKGSCSNLGANVMAELCCQVEQQACKDNLDGLHAIIEQIEREFRTVVRIMEDKMQSL